MAGETRSDPGRQILYLNVTASPLHLWRRSTKDLHVCDCQDLLLFVEVNHISLSSRMMIFFVKQLAAEILFYGL